MKLTGKLGNVNVELDRPEPMEQDGVWYEAVEFRSPKKGEMFKRCDKNHILPAICDEQDDGQWIMRPIPTPAPSQLKAIGYKLDGDRPREVKKDDVIWSLGNRCIGSYRWHLVKDDPAKVTGEEVELMICDHAVECLVDGCPHKVDHKYCGWKCSQYPDAHCVPCVKPKPPVAQAGKDEEHTSCEKHYSCAGCKNTLSRYYIVNCVDTCVDVEHGGERKNYTPQPPKGEDAPVYNHHDNRAIGWDKVYKTCCELGFELSFIQKERPDDEVCAFIRDLAGRAKTPKGEDAKENRCSDYLRAWMNVWRTCVDCGMDADADEREAAVCAFIRDLAGKAKTPKGEDAPKYNAFDNRAIGWNKVLRTCVELGFDPSRPKGLHADDDICTLIRDLHERANAERYSVESVAHWIFMSQSIFNMEDPECCLIESLNDLQDGIKAVTKRNQKE